jgi:hypothetical protein
MDAKKIREAKAKVERALAATAEKALKLKSGVTVRNLPTRVAFLETKRDILSMLELVTNVDVRLKDLRERATSNLTDIYKRLKDMEGSDAQALSTRLAAMEVRMGALSMIASRGLPGETVTALEKMIQRVETFEARLSQLEAK